MIPLLSLRPVLTKSPLRTLSPRHARRLATPSWVALSWAFVVSGACSPFATDLEQVDDPAEELRLEVSRTGIPSVAAGVVSDGALVWQGQYGFADVGEQRVADAGTFYVLASVSKLVVVTAAMQLAERGQLDLEADVNDYLSFDVRNPEYPDDPISALHLLTHTSGLNWPESETEIPGFYQPYPLDTSPALADWLSQMIPPNGELHVPSVWQPTRPGEREYYSNIGTALLAHVVERVSGMKFSAYCNTNIFEPLGMSSTSYAYADLDLAHAATQYGPTGRPLPHQRGLSYPAGDLKSTIEDFARLLIAYTNEGRYGSVRILQPGTIEDALTMRNEASGLALIWMRTVDGWYGHAGGKDGVAAYAEIHSASGVGLIVVANYRHNAVYPGNRIHALVRRIARQYM